VCPLPINMDFGRRGKSKVLIGKIKENIWIVIIKDFCWSFERKNP
jgi:hypothetical protein